MTVLDTRNIVSAGLQDRNPDERVMQHIIWGRTAYPFKSISPKELYKAASRFKRAADNAVTLCDFCDNKKAVDHSYACKRCANALERAKNG